MTSALTDRKQNAFAGEDDVSRYLQEIRSFPRLTPEEERQLAMRCAQGDQEAVRRMVNCNLRLVVSVAREYSGRGVALLDLIQEGSIGLITAANKFDYTKEFRFSTYATKWIRHGVTRCLMNHGQLIRVPIHTAEKLRKVLQAKAFLHQQLEEEPTVKQIAELCGMTEERVESLLQLNPQTCSLDAPFDEDTGSLGNLLEDLQAPQPHEELVRDELKHIMETLLGMLTPRQQRVLRLHYGMDDGVCHSLEEIRQELGVSKERVRQIEHQAMERLQMLGAGLGLEDFLE